MTDGIPEYFRMSSDDEGSVVVRVHFSNHSGSVAQIRICPEDICKIISNGKISESMYIDDWKCRIEKYEIFPKKKVFLIHARVTKGDLPKAPGKDYRWGPAVVIRDGRLLLVRERGKRAFSLPGGKARKGEPSLAAATRELAEELGMFPKSATRLFECDYQGAHVRHKVVLVETSDNPEIRSAEITAYHWWNGVENIPVLDHVRHIGGMIAAWTDFTILHRF